MKFWNNDSIAPSDGIGLSNIVFLLLTLLLNLPEALEIIPRFGELTFNAPDIGLVREVNNGRSDKKLISAKINGSEIGD